MATHLDIEDLHEGVTDSIGSLKKHRHLFLFTAVTEESMLELIADMLYLDSVSNEDIVLFINSPGGNTYDMHALYDVMRMIDSDIITVGLGMVASAATSILSSGTKGKRFCLPTTRLMIHEVHHATQGQTSDMEISIKETSFVNKQTAKILAKNTGQPYKKVLQDIKRNNWMSAYAAKRYGLIDKVVKARKGL